MKRMGLVGFGRFGQLIYQKLKADVEIRIHDPYQQRRLKDKALPFVGFEQIAEMPYLLLAVPVSAFEKTVQSLAGKLKPGTLVMDVCAVKRYPIALMKKYFAPEINIVGSHPLFGPDSAADTLADHLMIIYPVRIPRKHFREVREFWGRYDLTLIRMHPDSHDQLMAWTLALTHFLGRGLSSLPLPQTGLSTRDYQNLLQLIQKINNDTPELFRDMHRFNPYTKKMREAVIQSLQKLRNELDDLQQE